MRFEGLQVGESLVTCWMTGLLRLWERGGVKRRGVGRGVGWFMGDCGDCGDCGDGGDCGDDCLTGDGFTGDCFTGDDCLDGNDCLTGDDCLDGDDCLTDDSLDNSTDDSPDNSIDGFTGNTNDSISDTADTTDATSFTPTGEFTTELPLTGEPGFDNTIGESPTDNSESLNTMLWRTTRRDSFLTTSQL